jgi:hypothetical protein
MQHKTKKVDFMVGTLSNLLAKTEIGSISQFLNVFFRAQRVGIELAW